MKHINKFVSLFGGIFNLIKSPVIISDSSGNIIYHNDAFSETQLKSKAVKNKLLDEILPGLKASKILSIIKKEKIYFQEIEINDEKVRLFFGATYDERDSFSGMFIRWQTENEDKEVEEELLKNPIIRVLNAKNDMLWNIVNMQTRNILFVSNSIKNILGWEPHELLNGGWPFLLSLMHPSEHMMALKSHGEWLEFKKKQNLLYDHIPFIFQVKMRTRKGNYIHVEFESNVQQRDEDGNLKYVFASIKPLTVQEPNTSHNSAKFVKMIDGKLYIEFEFLKRLRGMQNSNGFPENPLTPREQEIVQFIVDGSSSEEIADILHLSKHTVNMHRKQIMRKLKAKNIAELIKNYQKMKNSVDIG